MGMYVYRVTYERVKLTDGTEANVARYAYKPSPNMKWNSRMANLTGCRKSERMEDSELTERVVLRHSNGALDPNVYENPRKLRTFLDDCNLGVPDRMPLVEGVGPAEGQAFGGAI